MTSLSPDATVELRRKLETSPTDLRKLVEAVLRRDCLFVAISTAAIDGWQRDDPTNSG
jgi:hypothetical protein